MRVERLIRMFMYRFGFKYLQKGADHMARPTDADGNKVPNSKLSKAERAKLQNSRNSSRNATRAAKMIGRFGRF